MATISASISHSDFIEITRPIIGMRMTRPWLGYASAFLADFGKLHSETIKFKNGKVRKIMKGQASIMLDCTWRLERTRTIVFGRITGSRKLAHAMKWLKGRQITGISLQGDIPELELELDSRFRLRSFMGYEGASSWCVFLRDVKLFPRPKQWTKKWLNRDHELWLHYNRGRLECELGF